MEDGMPYYRETYVNKASNSVTTRNGAAHTNFPMVLDDARIMTFRTRPKGNARSAEEILLEQSVDPYAYFLERESREKYQARLAERGLPADGGPDRGHAFQLSKYTLEGTPIAAATQVSRSGIGSPITTIVGQNFFLAPTAAQVGLSTGSQAPIFPAKLGTSGLDAFAQQAYQRTAPTSVMFDAARALGELRQGLPSVATLALKSRLRDFKQMGSDYLNVEFGWKPLIDDLHNMVRALASATVFMAGTGQRVHRRFGTPEQVSSYTSNFTSAMYVAGLGGVTSGPYGSPVSTPSGSFHGAVGVKGNFIRSQWTTRWFEGEFTNFMPLGFDPTDFFSRMNQLMNVKLTPQTLWELSPWSWLVDWNLRIGDSIAANELAANDLLVMHYGYAMEHTTYKDFVSIDYSAVQTAQPGSGSTWAYWQGLPASQTLVATTEYKQRIRANPFGFKTGGSTSLSSGQLAILGALGLTRLK
jgi:hypothetical protein